MQKPIQALLQDVRSTERFAPVYFLMGEEAFFLDRTVNILEERLLDESEKAFNLSVFYGLDSNFEQVVSAARSYPMMAQRRVVILKDAQLFKDLDKLESYVKNPVPSTVLLLLHRTKSLDKRKKIYKALIDSKEAILSESKPLKENELVDFISRYGISKSIKFHPKAGFALKELLGDNLQRIANEIDKIALALPAGSEVQLQEVAERVGMGREYNIFEVPGLIASGNKSRMYRMIQQMAKNPNQYPFPMLTASLYNFFSKILAYHGVVLENNLRKKRGEAAVDPFREVRVFDRKEFEMALQRFPLSRAQQAILILESYDLKFKGVGNEAGTAPGALMREMAWKLLNL
jgi:DNA polymerase III subunit delta